MISTKLVQLPCTYLKTFLFPNCSMKSSEKIIFPFCPTMEKTSFFFLEAFVIFLNPLFPNLTLQLRRRHNKNTVLSNAVEFS